MGPKYIYELLKKFDKPKKDVIIRPIAKKPLLPGYTVDSVYLKNLESHQTKESKPMPQEKLKRNLGLQAMNDKKIKTY